ncbi:hypothetical protein NC653_020620 [Populus alba x Populus x berolinensis]|uniref:Uncharacterized protein n=1 Tax=Populus alba x Populus x berolinensis TaxID=444605 RepID=A0AAD6MMP7_9ROSI|nr:hypothetical protein NC653_020620 [Populus alba x Populus x berolinensis]
MAWPGEGMGEALGGAWGCLVADGRRAVPGGAWWLMTRIVEREVN